MMEDFYMPTDIQFKDDLRKEEIKLEELLSLLKNQEYEKLQKKLERDLKAYRTKEKGGWPDSPQFSHKSW